MQDGAPDVSAPSRMEEINGVANDERAQQVLRVAERLFGQNPNWVTFFHAIFGVDGVVQKLYPQPENVAEFERSKASFQIQSMLTRLREQRPDEARQQAPQRMITVRLPAPVYEALTQEAVTRKISLNQLCISKLVRLIDNKHVPVNEPSPRARAARARTRSAGKPKLKVNKPK